MVMEGSGEDRIHTDEKTIADREEVKRKAQIGRNQGRPYSLMGEGAKPLL